MNTRVAKAALASLAALSTLTACADPAPLVATVPDDVNWLALIALAEPGRVERASALQPWPKGQALPLIAPSDREIVLAGYTTAQLERFAPDQALETAELRAAIGCEDHLPAPAWAARWTTADALTPLDDQAIAAQLPPLTSEALITRCPKLTDLAISTDVDCVDRRCAPQLTPGGAACTFELTLPDCDLGPLRATVWSSREICLDPEPAPRAGCAVSAYTEPTTAAFEVQATNLFDRPRSFTPDWLSFNGLLIPDLLFEGSAYDLAYAGDQIVVAAETGLLFFDPETLALTRTATAHAISRLAARAGATELFGVFKSAGQDRIGRFDLQGRLIEDAPTGGAELRALDLELLPELERLVILFNPIGDHGKSGNGGNLIITHDATTLIERSRFQYLRGQRWTSTPIGGGALALANHRTRAIDWLHADTGTIADSTALPRIEGLIDDDSLLELSFDRRADRLLVAGTRNPLLFSIAPRGSLIARGYIFDRDLDPVAVLPDAGAENRVWVTGITQAAGGYESYLTRADAKTGRFFPGAQRLGPGIASRMIAGPQADVFILLPWSAQLIRARNLPPSLPD